MHRSLLLAALLASLPAAHADPGAFFGDVGGASVRVPVKSLKQAKSAGTVLQQYDFSCGSAALATLLTHHYGHPVVEQDVLQSMYAAGDREKIHREGFSLLDMKRYLAGLGFTADGFEQPLEKLAETRIPAVVLVNEQGYRHFVVVKGLEDGRVLFGDPARGTRALPVQDFKRVWVGGLLFVIHNRMDRARFNLREDWQVVPRAPLKAGPANHAAGIGALPRLGPGDF